MPKEIVIDGITYPSIQRASVELGIKYVTLYARIKKGMKDLTRAPMTQEESKGVPITINGVTYPSIRKAARELHLHYATLRCRITHSFSGNLGDRPMTREECVAVAVKKTSKSLAIDNVTYSSIYDAAKELGLAKSTFYNRLSCRNDVELTHAPLSQKECIDRAHTSQRKQKLKSLLFS